jgi:GntR family transcriptional regulator
MAKHYKARSSAKVFTANMKVTQERTLPLYVQVRELLRAQILEGRFGAHEQIPPESELTQFYGVSRITVRLALRDLQAAGLIFTVLGKGTFVNELKAVRTGDRRQIFEEAMDADGTVTFAQVISVCETLPTSIVHSALKLGPTKFVVEVKRVRYLNAMPISLDVSYFPPKIGRALMGQDLTRDISGLLENELGMAFGTSDFRVKAHLPDLESQVLLAVLPREAVLRVERLNFDANDRPIHLECLTYRGDLYQCQFRTKK